MPDEPGACHASDLFESTGLLEQMRGVRDDGELSRDRNLVEGRADQLENGGIGSPDDSSQSWQT
jgi:hypothetical protein